MRKPQVRPARTKQICVCVTPELLEKFKVAAAMDNVPYSFKAYQLIQEFVDSKQQKLEKYAEFMANINNEE